MLFIEKNFYFQKSYHFLDSICDFNESSKVQLAATGSRACHPFSVFLDFSARSQHCFELGSRLSDLISSDLSPPIGKPLF